MISYPYIYESIVADRHVRYEAEARATDRYLAPLSPPSARPATLHRAATRAQAESAYRVTGG